MVNPGKLKAGMYVMMALPDATTAATQKRWSRATVKKLRGPMADVDTGNEVLTVKATDLTALGDEVCTVKPNCP